MQNKITKPEWVKRGNLVWTSPMNEAPCYMRRLGKESAQLVEYYKWISTEQFMKLYADIGIKNIYPYFHKGHGLNAERRHFPELKKMIDNAHRYGITVAPYAQFNSIMYEAFLDEIPGAREWRRLDNWGRPQTYGPQDFRWKPCPSHRGFVEYQKKVIQACIVELGCDGIFFDNFGYVGDVVQEYEWWEACHCDACQKGFKEFLKKKYPGDPYPLFGIPNFNNIEIPDSYLRQEDPLVREYWYFFGNLMKDVLAELYAYMKSLKPDAALGTNSAIFPTANPYYCKGISDMVCWEDLSYPRIEGGCLISEIHQCKTATAVGANVIKLGGQYEWKPDADCRLGMAEGMAYGSHSPQMGYKLPRKKGKKLSKTYNDAKGYVHYFLKNSKIYREPESAATVAILYSHDSMIRDFRHAYACLKGMQHICLLNHIPFDLVFPENLGEADFIKNRLPKYQALLLPDAKYLPAQAVQTIKNFVKAGGGLYASGETSLYDSIFRAKHDFDLAEVFGVAYEDVLEEKIKSLHFNYFGKGRVAYTPTVPEKAVFLDKDGNPPKDMKNFSFQSCVKYKLPEESNTVVEAIRAVSAKGLPIEAVAPFGVTLDMYKKGNACFVHFLNHEPEKPKSNMLLRVHGWFKKVKAARLYSPDHPNKVIKLKVMHTEDRVEIIVPRIEVYGVVELL